MLLVLLDRLILWSFFDFYVAAVPVVSKLTPKADPTTSPSQDGNRSLMFSIVWGCLSTIFLCAWVSVHPNIPKPGRFEGIFRRFQLLFWMLVAPDLILVLAMRQWVAAGQIADIYNETKLKASKRKLPTWTRAHGHFIIMGGLTLIGPTSEDTSPDYSDSIGQVMSYEQFLHFVNDPSFDFPIMTEDDINDRTRGDFLSKSIAVLQTTWFVVQCITRGIQRLAVTELELTTLGLCTVSLMTYIFWWHKPLDAKTQIRVYLKIGQSPLRENNDVDSLDDTTGFLGQRARRGLLNRIKRISANIINIFQFDSSESLTAIVSNFLFLLPLNLLYLLFVIFVAPAVLLYYSAANMALTTTVPPGASHVPPSYTPNTNDAIAGAVFAFFGAIFGGIHLIGWNFVYPTFIEQTLWRVSALLITVTPSFVFFVEHLARYTWGQPGSEEMQRFEIHGLGRKFVLFLMVIASFLLSMYYFARISLLVQSFVLLRKQPPSAFYPVDWTKFFPHLS